jgi:hypothetical protein
MQDPFLNPFQSSDSPPPVKPSAIPLSFQNLAKHLDRPKIKVVLYEVVRYASLSSRFLPSGMQLRPRL